jgi:pyrimidine deaminase RibD-like protein
MRAQDFHIMNHQKLDGLLVELCQEVVDGQKKDPKYYGMVAAGVLDPDNNFVKSCNIPKDKDHRIHAERAAIDKYNKLYGDIPQGSIILTTLSPCSDAMDERYSSSCTDLINKSVVHKVYCGYMDPTQGNSQSFKHKQFTLKVTNNKQIQELCKQFADTFLEKNINERKETKSVTIHTNPYYRGATIGAGVKEQLPVTKMPIDELQMWESDKTLRTKAVRDWVKNTLIPKLEDKGRLMPMIVWNRKGKYFVIDGNHRFLAYKAAGFKGDVPVKVVPQEMIAINNKVLDEGYGRYYCSTDKKWKTRQGPKQTRNTNENFADGKGPGKPGDSQRHGIPKGATMAQLQKAAKAPGRKGQLARWQINMRRGKKK